MPRKHKPKRKAPQPSRLEKAQAWFSYLAREYKAIGIRMVNARLEFLEADAEERAKMHLEYPDDEVIKRAAEQAAQDLHDWNVKMGRVQEIEETTKEDGTTAYALLTESPPESLEGIDRAIANVETTTTGT